MAIALVQQAEGASATAVTTPAFSGATTAGNLIVLAFVSDDYNGTPDAGWTQSAEMEQQTFHGGYIWWKISTGETTTPSYTIGSATVSAWILAEFSGTDTDSPYDVSEGQFAASSAGSYTTPTITPTTGARLLVAMIGGSRASDNNPDYNTWLNSFTEIADIGTTAGATDDCVGLAYRLVTGDGSTTFSSGATYGSLSEEARTGLIISFKEDDGVGPLPGTLNGSDSANGGTGANPNNCAISPSVVVAAGDLIFVAAGQQTTLQMSSATDNLGNTYSSAGTGLDGGTNAISGFYSIVTVAGTLTNVAVAGQTTTANDFAICVAIFQGPFSAVDKTIACANDATTPFACPSSGTLAQANELVIGYGSVGTTAAALTATSPNSMAIQAANSTTIRTAIGYQVVAATTAVAPVFAGTSANASWGTATFRISTSSGNVTLTAAAGSYAATGAAATERLGHTAAAGSYTLTGSASSFLGLWPDANSTGVEDGITLTAYSGPSTITTDDTLVENKIIDGGIEITAANVTLRNCRIENATIHGISASDATNLTVEHCDVIGTGGTGVSTGILAGGTITANDVSGFALGMSITAASVVSDNYIHDLHKDGVDVHYDGIAFFGGGGSLVEHNAIHVPLQVDGGATACIFLKDFFGAIDDITINNNLLRGEPAYTIQIDGQTDDDTETITNVSVTNNVMEEGVFGYFSVDVPSTTYNITGSGNIDYLTGDEVEFPDVGFTLTAAAGSYALTGSDANLSAGGNFTLTAAAGSYTLTGSDAVLATGFSAAAGTYTITGSDADLTFTSGDDFTLTAAAGGYALAGSDADLTIAAGDYTLTAEAGAYTLSGASAGFIGVEVTPEPVPAPSPGGAGRVAPRYKRLKVKKKRKRDELEELLDAVRRLPDPPPAEAVEALVERGVAPGLLETPSSRLMPQVRLELEDEDEDEIALLLEILS